uniref:Aa_trans domain-containing protein n=1 Tax=Macrostomum lignano TaxID=282301 RepID=A0A1I8FKQ5_9PLAT
MLVTDAVKSGSAPSPVAPAFRSQPKDRARPSPAAAVSKRCSAGGDDETTKRDHNKSCEVIDAPRFEWLVFLRTVAGAFMATHAAGPGYMVECCPATARAYLLNIGFVVWSVGPRAGARRRSGTQRCRRRQRNLADPRHSVCPAHHRQLRAYWLVPETPRFYLPVHGQMDKCKASLRHIARAKTAEAPRVKWLFSRRLRSLTLGLAAISFLTNFTYYGGVLFAQQLVQESGMSNSVAEVLQSSCGGADCRPLSQRDYVKPAGDGLVGGARHSLSLCPSAPTWKGGECCSVFGPAVAKGSLWHLCRDRRPGWWLHPATHAEQPGTPRSPPLLVSLLFFARGSAVVTINISNIYAPEAVPHKGESAGRRADPAHRQVVMPASRIAGLVVYAGAFVVVVLLAAFCLSRETKDADLEDQLIRALSRPTLLPSTMSTFIT